MKTKCMHWHVSAYISKFNFCNISALIKNNFLWFHSGRYDPSLKAEERKSVIGNYILKQNIRNFPVVLQHKLNNHLHNIDPYSNLLTTFVKHTTVSIIPLQRSVCEVWLSVIYVVEQNANVSSSNLNHRPYSSFLSYTNWAASL